MIIIPQLPLLIQINMKFTTILVVSLTTLASALPVADIAIPRGNVPDTVELGVDEFNNWGIDHRGKVPDVTNLATDIVPESAVAKDNIIARGIAWLTKRETDPEATDRLLFSTSISNFLYAKSIKNPGSLDWTDDGCSNSPDAPAGYNFLPSCQRHDFGYRNYKKQGRFTDANRLRIDNNFKSDLYNQCATYNAASEVSFICSLRG